MEQQPKQPLPQSQTAIYFDNLTKSKKQTIEQLSPEMKRQLGAYIQILNKRQSLQQTSLLKDTILADSIRPKVMFLITIKILLAIVLLIYFMNIFLPHPLKVQVQGVQHNSVTGDQCTQKTCENFSQNIQQMQIRKLSPLNRKIAVYIELDQNQFKNNLQAYKDIGNQTVTEQIDKVEIFRTMKDGEEVEEIVSSIQGEEIIEEIVNGKPMYFAGDVSVIDSPNFLVRVIKKSKKNPTNEITNDKDKADNEKQTKKRLLSLTRLTQQSTAQQSDQTNPSQQTNNLHSQPSNQQTIQQKNENENLNNQEEQKNSQEQHNQGNENSQIQSQQQNSNTNQEEIKSEPENNVQPQPQPQPQPNPQPQPQPNPDPQPQPQPQPNVSPQPEPQPQPNVNPQPEPTPQPNPEPQPNVNPQPQPQPQPQPSPQPQPQPQPQPSPQPQPQAPTQHQSYPLLIRAFYRTYSYTFLQLLFRFTFLVLSIYVTSQTPESPHLLHYIMISYCNPFIFLQVASPTFLFSLIGSICQSSYIFYLLIFMYYTHSKSKNVTWHYFFLAVKLLVVVVMFVVNVLRLQHTYEDFQVYSLETTLVVTVLVLLGTYVWDMIVYYKQQLYRDIVNVTITLWYMLLGFVSGWAIMLGWEELVRFVIVQIFAINLCYLVSRYQVNPKWVSMMKTKQILLGYSKESSNSFEDVSVQVRSTKYPTEQDHIKQATPQKKKMKKRERKTNKRQEKLTSSQNPITQQNTSKQFSPQKTQPEKDSRQIKYIDVRTNKINYM